MTTSVQPLHTIKSLPPGYRFNEFEILETIGGGGFGIVYLAFDHLLDRTVAIKEYMPNSLAQRNEDLSISIRNERHGKSFKAGLQSFENEAKILAKFNHPALVHVYRFWSANGTYYMATQFYSGKTLKQLITSGTSPVNEEWLKNLLPSLLSAIQTLHSENCLHRDIALDNIMLQDNGTPVLLDLGSAKKTIGNLSDQTEIMLRPGYAPIEQYTDNDSDEQGPWTDIYALSAVLHTLITNNPPPVSVVRCIEDNYIPLTERKLANYSPEFLEAIDNGLKLQPEQRPQSIEEFANSLGLFIPASMDLIMPFQMPQMRKGQTANKKSKSARSFKTKLTNLKFAICYKSSYWKGQLADKLKLSDRKHWIIIVSLSLAILLIIFGLFLLVRSMTLTNDSGTNTNIDAHDAMQQPEQIAQAQQNNQTAVSAIEQNSVENSSTTSASAETKAILYIRLSGGETLTLNGQPVDSQYIQNNMARIPLPLETYKLDITKGDLHQLFTVDLTQPGTTIISSPY